MDIIGTGGRRGRGGILLDRVWRKGQVLELGQFERHSLDVRELLQSFFTPEKKNTF